MASHATDLTPHPKSGKTTTGCDVTSRSFLEQRNKYLEEKLQRLEDLEFVEQMTGGIAHDFNSILHPIISFASMGLRKTENQVDLQSYFSSINTAAQRARDVAQKILVLVRRNKQDLFPIRLSEIVMQLLQMQQADMPSNIKIEQKIDCSYDFVVGDPTQFQQMVMNLISNAVHAMKSRGGILWVALEPSEELGGDSPAHVDALCLTVSDTGTGMSPEEIEKIFTPFYSSKPKSQGTGLGLSIVDKIVKSCNGRIEVESVAGKGSEFRIFLPVFKKSAADNVPEAAVVCNEHLLLVDPEENGVNGQADLLRAQGYQISVCKSGEEAWRAVQDKPTAFDLILVNLILPGMSGYRLAMKVLDIRPDLSIILSMTHNTQVNVKQARSIGIQEVLFKPFTEKQLASTLRAVLDAG